MSIYVQFKCFMEQLLAKRKIYLPLQFILGDEIFSPSYADSDMCGQAPHCFTTLLPGLIYWFPGQFEKKILQITEKFLHSHISICDGVWEGNILQ